jgi:tetratricopeptide (TPR) repeat protein
VKLAEVLTADQPQVALQLLEQSLELNPDNADIVFRIGLLYLDQRRSVEAMDYFRKTQQLMPTHPGLPEALKQAQNLSNQ